MTGPRDRFPDAYPPAPPGLAVYPLALGQVLHGSWIKFDFRAMLSSDWRSHVAFDAMAVGHLLWGEACAQATAGTLPDDDVALARMTGLGRDVAAWRDYRARGALWGWEPILCLAWPEEAPDDDALDLGEPLRLIPGEAEVRLHHPRLTLSIVEAVRGVEKARDAGAEVRRRKEFERVRNQMRALGLRKELVEAYDLQRAVHEWLDANGHQIRRERVREALVFHGFGAELAATVTDIRSARENRRNRH